jgi:serine/threonine protein kinase/Tfp pilus assembly protein PilF
MNPERYQKICDIFAEASEIAPENRAAFLDEKCGDDKDLLSEVESLLASDKESGDFIEAPALEVAAEILADEKANTKIGLEIGHYQIISLLGAGGMGEVWLAEDVRLKRRIALKLISDIHKNDSLLRFEQEAEAASALNHPNIITIFDIGQSAGFQFIATEYINGKTLRRLIREKSPTVKESVEIAAQICAALVAAHSAGIIHRDIKPENIMVREDGLVKVLDFGLARFSAKNTSNPDAKFITKPGMIMGTVTYMSPEQARALPVDERTDIFSLGIVLHEMLTGKQPFEGANEIEVLAAILERPPRELDAKLPDAVKNIVAKALNKNHLERPTAEEMLNELRSVQRNLEISTEAVNRYATDNLHNLETVQMMAVTGNNNGSPTGRAAFSTSAKSFVRSPRGSKIAAAFSVLLTAIIGIAVYQLWIKSQAPAVLNEADKLLVAEFENKTGDEEFDNIFRQPLAVGLAQSPFISLVPDGQIRQTLKQMEKPPGEPLTYEIAREICQRRGVKAFLKGSIENYGVKYLVTLEAFNAETGESVAREQIESANKETVIDSLDEATDEMREKLGESLASIKRFDQPLKTSTTASLEALKAYSLATKNLSDGKLDDGITLLKQAVEIDPNYASAYASLAAAYSNKQQMSAAAEFAAKAFALRDRMTERDKQKITGFYYVFVTGEIEKDIENLEVVKQMFPRDSTIPLNLGASYIELGKFAKAEENARLAINLEPTLFFPYSNLGKYLSRQSRFAESKAVYEDALNRGFESEQINSGLFTAAFALGDEAGMQQQLKILEEGKNKDAVFRLKGNAAIFSGKASEYEKLINQFVAENEKDAADLAADYAVQAAVNLAALDKCANATNWANRALKLDRGQPTLTDATFALALCGGQTEPLIAELKDRFPRNTVVNSIWLPVIRAATEMETAPDRALEALEINRQFEGATYFWDNYLRGKIYARLGQNDSAASEFQKITENRGWSVHSPLFALAHLELARVYKLENDAANAEKYSARFADLWKNADKNLSLVKESAEKAFLSEIF